MRFTGYSFGSILVDGVTYDHDLVIDRGKIRKRKKAASRRFRGGYGHTPLSAAEDIPWRCRRLVIGTGAAGALPVLQQVREEARHAATVLDQIDAAARELAGLPAEAGTVRLGWFTSAGASLLPRALATLRRTHPAITVITREGSTPALVRALRAGSVDLALLASAPPFRPPDAETPPLDLQVLAERSLCLAVPATHPLARQNAADVADLRGQRWIASPSAADETLMGVWPGLDERPKITHTARDWLTKLHLVAAGCGVTTVPASFAAIAPPGVRVLAVRGGSQEQRRVILAGLPHPLTEPAARLADALRAAAADAPTPR